MSDANPLFHVRITPDESGRRLDEFLASRLGGLSRMRIATLLEGGKCLVNQTAAPAGYHIATGDLIEMALDGSTPTAMSPEPIPLEILHEDDHLLVVVKPAGILVHPTRSVKTGTLANALAYHLNRQRIAESRLAINSSTESHGDDLSKPTSLGFQPVTRPGMVHRLDRATSGLMVIAKTQRALTILSRHFHQRLVEKRYTALVCGEVVEDSFEINAPIGRDENRRPRWWVMDSGRHARTRLEVRERIGKLTLVELEPVTGRTNQLRIHCAYRGFPVLGDELYGGSEVQPGCVTMTDSLAPGMDDNAAVVNPPVGPSSRLCLHASRLAFHHPAGGTWLEFNAPLPSDWPDLSNDGNSK